MSAVCDAAVGGKMVEEGDKSGGGDVIVANQAVIFNFELFPKSQELLGDDRILMTILWSRSVSQD